MNKTEYLLTCLSEECAEVQKLCSKSIRFGLDDCHPDDPQQVSNSVNLSAEVVDVMAIINMLGDEGALANWSPEEVGAMIEQKKQRVLKYMDYSQKKNKLQ